jgi:hypothetical protein
MRDPPPGKALMMLAKGEADEAFTSLFTAVLQSAS